MVDGAIKQLGDFSVLVKAFIDQLRKNYAAGVEDLALIGPNDDPGLLFNISIDYEQMIVIPNTFSSGDTQVSFVYANAQVMFLKPPRQGDGDLRILYSLPFRVQSLVPVASLNRIEHEKIFAQLLTGKVSGDDSGNLVNTFGRYLRGKRFLESSVPRRLKVRQVSVTPEATASNTQMGILQNVGADFVGRAFSVALAEYGGYSVVPYGPSEATTRALALQFDRMPNIGDLIKELGRDEQIDIAIDLSFHRSFKVLDNSNGAANAYKYGVSFIVKVTDVINKKVVFDKKIQMIVDRGIAKLLLNRASDYDKRFMVQLIILLFDTFIPGLVKEDPLILSKVGLDPIKDMGEVKALKALLINAKYNG